MTAADLRGASLPIYEHQNDALDLTLTFLDAAGSALDLSGYTITANVYTAKGAVAQAITLASPTANSRRLTLTATQMGVLARQRNLTWSLQADTGSNPQTWIAGPFGVSRPGHGSDYQVSGTFNVTVNDTSVDVTVNTVAIGGGGVTDHGALTGLADDDHTQYALADGSRGSFLTAAGSATVTNKTLQSFTNTIDADALHVEARNVSGVTITKGSVVYPTGYNVGADIVEVGLADSSAASTMPAIGVAEEDIANNSNGSVVVRGRIEGIDTSSYSVGDVLYVSETAGAMTATAPTGAAVVQVVATVLRSNVSTGVIDVEPALGPTTSGFIATLLDDASASDARTTLGLGSAALATGATDADNTLLGTSAGGSMTSAANNVAVGTSALAAITTTNSNVAVGHNALAAYTSTNNVAVGPSAMPSATVADECVAIGAQTLLSITDSSTARENTAVGFDAGQGLTSGGSNTFIGHSAGEWIKTGNANVAVGRGALNGVDVGGGTATNNVSIGNLSMVAIDGGDSNVAVGRSAMQSLADGNSNVGIGSSVATSLTGSSNVIIGASAGAAPAGIAGNASTNGNRNVFIGQQSGGLATTNNAIAVGYRAVAEQANAVAVGYQADAGHTDAVVLGTHASTAADQLQIGDVHIEATELAGDPGAAGAGVARLYLKDDTGRSRLYIQDDTGVEQFALVSELSGGSTSSHFVVKTSDEGVTNSDVLQNDDDLAFSIGANEVWTFEFGLYVMTTSTTSEIDVTVTTPTGATIRAWVMGHGTSGTVTPTNMQTLGLIDTSGEEITAGTINDTSNNGTFVLIHGSVINGANAGTIQLQWAQNVATASTTLTVKANSYMKANLANT